MKKRYCFLVMSLLAFIILVACGQKTVEKREGLKIVTSFYPIYAMVKEVSGERNDVRMLQSSAGIHGYEPSATDIAAIVDADLFVYHSQILESWAAQLDPSLKDSKVQVLEAAREMDLDKVLGLEDRVSGQDQEDKKLYDPHTWLDPEKVAEEVMIIARKLSDIDSEHKAEYERNAQKMTDQLHALTKQYQTIFDQASKKTFVTQHTAFSYLAKRFGLKQLGIAGISSEQEPSPRQLTEIQDFVKQYQVETIFTETTASPKVAQTLASATGVRLKELNPLEAPPQTEKSYLEQLTENLETLATELK